MDVVLLRRSSVSMALIIYVLTTEMTFGLSPYSFASSSSFGIDNTSNNVHMTMAASKSTPSNQYQIRNASEPNHADLRTDVWCKGRADETAYADLSSRCRRYFRCYGGKRLVFLCPGKLVFNGQRCVFAVNYSCPAAASETNSPDSSSLQKPKDCDGLPDGYHADPESGCRSYFFCSSGLKTTYVCPGKTLFDGSKCVDQTTYKCPYSSPDCLGLGTGYYADYSSGCRRYYFCSDGNKLITLTCSDGRLFNGKRCAEPSQYKCPTTASSTEIPADVSSLPDASNLSIVQRKAVVPSIEIPPTILVNARVNSRSTPPPVVAETPTQKPSDCEKNYGFFVVKGTQCQKYYFCIGGSRTDLSCPGTSVFNGQVCVDPAQYTCPENPVASDRIDEEVTEDADESRPCAGKPDGVYVDRTSGCRSYYLCSRGLITTFNCPANQLFDGRRCTESRKVLCDNEALVESRANVEDNQCSGRVSGLYLEKNSPDCRGYVYCRTGRVWASARCGSSERFHDQVGRCVPAYEVTCASDVTESSRRHDLVIDDSSSSVTEANNETITTTTEEATSSHAQDALTT